MPDPKLDLNAQCHECMSSLISISNYLTVLQSKSPIKNVEVYLEQLKYISTAIERLKIDLLALTEDEIPY